MPRAKRQAPKAVEKNAPKGNEKSTEPTKANEDLLGAIEQLRGLLEKQSRELESQRATLAEQQKRMAALEEQLTHPVAGPQESANQDSMQDAKPSAVKILEGQLEAVADSQAQLSKKVSTLETTSANNQKNTETKLRGFGLFTFSGDVRFRAESFFGSGLITGAEPPDRHRERFRALQRQHQIQRRIFRRLDADKRGSDQSCVRQPNIDELLEPQTNRH